MYVYHFLLLIITESVFKIQNIFFVLPHLVYYDTPFPFPTLYHLYSTPRLRSAARLPESDPRVRLEPHTV